MSAHFDIAASCRRGDGLVEPGKLAEALQISKSDLAAGAGLSRDAVYRTSRLASHRTQQRLNEVVEILDKVLPWTGHPRIAYAWYRSQGLPGFGGLTAEDLVKSGRSEDVQHYLSRISVGGYA